MLGSSYNKNNEIKLIVYKVGSNKYRWFNYVFCLFLLFVFRPLWVLSYLIVVAVRVMTKIIVRKAEGKIIIYLNYILAYEFVSLTQGLYCL